MAATKKPAHGGKRRGAGRKPIGDEALTERITIRLTHEQREWVEAGGAGDAGAVVRWLIDERRREFRQASELLAALPPGGLVANPKHTYSSAAGSFKKGKRP